MAREEIAAVEGRRMRDLTAERATVRVNASIDMIDDDQLLMFNSEDGDGHREKEDEENLGIERRLTLK